MGLWSWIKDLFRQVVDDDLEGIGAHPDVTGAPQKRRQAAAGPLLSERDLGATDASAAPAAPQDRGGRGGGEDDEAAAAAWVLHDQGKDDGRGR